MDKIEKVKTILNNYNELQGKKISLEYMLELDCDLKALDYNGLSGGQGGVPGSEVEQRIVDHCMSEEELKAKLKLYDITINRINKTLSSLTEEERKVIQWLFFDRMTREEAAGEMYDEFKKSSVRTVDRRRDSAIRKLITMRFYEIPIRTMVNLKITG